MKRTLSAILALILTLSAVSFTAFAADDDLAPSGASYGLWLGTTQVTDENKDNILNDGGSAKFNPSTKTLTLNQPTINGTHSGCKIYSYNMDLTIKGSFHMTQEDLQCGLSVKNNLILDGDFTFIGKKRGIDAGGDINIVGGRLVAEAVDPNLSEFCIFSYEGNITIGSKVEYFEASTASYGYGAAAVLCDSGKVIIESPLTVTTPIGGIAKRYCIYESDGETEAKHVIIEPASSTGVTVSGTVKSYLSETDQVTLRLYQSGAIGKIITVTGNNASFSFSNVSSGIYILNVSKKNHVARKYNVLVFGNRTENVEILPIGDVAPKAGVVNIRDVNVLYNHVMETEPITDEYLLQCGDVDNKNGVNIRDVNALYNHVMETALLY